MGMYCHVYADTAQGRKHDCEIYMTHTSQPEDRVPAIWCLYSHPHESEFDTKAYFMYTAKDPHYIIHINIIYVKVCQKYFSVGETYHTPIVLLTKGQDLLKKARVLGITLRYI